MYYLRNKTSQLVFYRKIEYRYEFGAYELKHECFNYESFFILRQNTGIDVLFRF